MKNLLPSLPEFFCSGWGDVLKIAFGSVLGFFADRLFFRDIKRHIKQKEAIEILEIILKLARRKRLSESEKEYLYILIEKDIWFSHLSLETAPLSLIASTAEESLRSITIKGYREARRAHKAQTESENQEDYEISEFEDKFLFPLILLLFYSAIGFGVFYILSKLFPLSGI